ncbi:hypothetical protein COBT_003241, partial [Conglomerata obtusa]
LKIRLITNIKDFFKEFLLYYKEFESKQVFCFHQADIIDINNENAKIIEEMRQINFLTS